MLYSYFWRTIFLCGRLIPLFWTSRSVWRLVSKLEWIRSRRLFKLHITAVFNPSHFHYNQNQSEEKSMNNWESRCWLLSTINSNCSPCWRTSETSVCRFHLSLFSLGVMIYCTKYTCILRRNELREV